MKKLFSYLLISSMVVLSSCTNYDDQFDDLNTQINALKTQIAGFSSLSTGLTSLQGTVASLQSAVANIPATDLSGLESDLTDLSALVKALQAQVAATATALEAGTVSDAAIAAAIKVVQDNQTALDTAVAAVTAAQATLATAADVAAVTAAQTAADAAAVKLAAAVADLATELTALGTTNAELKTVTDLIQAAVKLLSEGQAANTTSIGSLVDAVAALDTASLSTLINTLSTSVTTNTDQILASILAANSIYSTAISITDNASLDFAVALGDQLKVVNESVSIVQSRDMDVTKLQSVMDKFVSVVQGVSYTATATGITSIGTFKNLSSTKSLTLDVAGDISLPALTSVTNNVTIANNTKLTEISAPLLTKVGSFGFSTYTKVNSVDLSSLLRAPSDSFSLTVDSGTVDLSSLITTTDATPSVERTSASIEVDGATIVKAPLITSGTLLMDEVIEPNFPVWQGSSTSKFDNAEKVVLPSIEGAFTINLEFIAPEATYFHYIGNDGDSASTANDDETYKFPAFVSLNNTNIETLIIGGSSTSVSVTGASDLTSFTITGGTHSLVLSNNDAMTSYDLGHTSTIVNNEFGSVSSGSLTISLHDRLESVTAASLDDISSLQITSNTKLETLSFAKLNSLGTDTEKEALAAGDASVNIYGNSLSASNIQLPSEYNELPVVKGAITTTSGITAISDWIGLALAKRGTATAIVRIDKVNTITDKAGEAVTASSNSPRTIGVPKTAAAGLSATNITTWAGEDTSVDIVNLNAGTPGPAKIEQTYQRSTYGLDATGTFETDDFISIDPNGVSVAKVTFSAAFKQKYGITNTFSTTDLDTWASAAESELNAQLDAGSYNFTVEIEKDFGTRKEYLFDLYLDGALSESAGRVGAGKGVITFTYGSTVLTNTVSEDTDEGIHEALARAINNSSLSDSYSVATITGGVRVTPEVDNVRDYSSNPTFLTFGFGDNYDATSADSATSFLGASMTIAKTGESLDTGYRLTVINDSKTLKANLLDYTGATTSFTSKSGTVVFTELTDGVNFSGTDNDLQRDWDDVTAEVPAGDPSGDSFVNLTDWL